MNTRQGGVGRRRGVARVSLTCPRLQDAGTTPPRCRALFTFIARKCAFSVHGICACRTSTYTPHPSSSRSRPASSPCAGAAGSTRTCYGPRSAGPWAPAAATEARKRLKCCNRRCSLNISSTSQCGRRTEPVARDWVCAGTAARLRKPLQHQACVDAAEGRSGRRACCSPPGRSGRRSSDRAGSVAAPTAASSSPAAGAHVRHRRPLSSCFTTSAS